ncbi:glycosyltransferase family 2 protein [Pseudonocardiaceae bacterium YIM PH 21723]|nr:glycosyltransferase family 2 protein [Pseudonocardiaceae bacterium YIM PH 21723]
MLDLPPLSVVIPVFNEPVWIRRSIDALFAASSCAGWRLDVVVVDDGSTDDTGKVLAELVEQHGIRVITQVNSGRFAARQRGMAEVTGDFLLLLDSRVILHSEALRFLGAQLAEHPDRLVWNGHINVDAAGNPYAAFWAALEKIGWRRYLAKPRLMSYGLDEFDAFPKGTGMFCGPADLLRAATQHFETLYDDVKFASDDTGMLRWIAGQQRFHIAPEFNAIYHGRDSFKKFVKHCNFRGTTFVDSYLGHAGPVRTVLIAAILLGFGWLAVLVLWPLVAISLVLLGLLGAGALVRRCGASWAEVRATVWLAPIFAASFGAGVLRGLWLAGKARLSR